MTTHPQEPLEKTNRERAEETAAPCEEREKTACQVPRNPDTMKPPITPGTGREKNEVDANLERVFGPNGEKLVEAMTQPKDICETCKKPIPSFEGKPITGHLDERFCCGHPKPPCSRCGGTGIDGANEPCGFKESFKLPCPCQKPEPKLRHKNGCTGEMCHCNPEPYEEMS